MKPILTRRRGASTPEYVLLLALFLGLILFVFWDILGKGLSSAIERVGNIIQPSGESLTTEEKKKAVEKKEEELPAPKSGSSPGLFSGWPAGPSSRRGSSFSRSETEISTEPFTLP